MTLESRGIIFNTCTEDIIVCMSGPGQGPGKENDPGRMSSSVSVLKMFAAAWGRSSHPLASKKRKMHLVQKTTASQSSGEERHERWRAKLHRGDASTSQRAVKLRDLRFLTASYMFIADQKALQSGHSQRITHVIDSPESMGHLQL